MSEGKDTHSPVIIEIEQHEHYIPGRGWGEREWVWSGRET